MKREIIAAGLIALATLAVYAPVAGHEFVNYDDGKYVSDNPRVLAGLTPEGLRWAFATGHAANWHPLTWLSHMLDVELFGTWAGGHHLASVLIHAANAVLLMFALSLMTGAVWRSAFVAGLFALHPLHVESVAWVAERKDVLSGLFAMLTLIAYIHYVRRPSAARYAAVLALFAAGLMAKPMLVTLPFVLLLFDVWPLGRLAASGAPTAGGVPAGRRAGARPERPHRSQSPGPVAEKLPLFALSAASCVVTWLVQRGGGAVAAVEEFSLLRRSANALMAYPRYILKMLWPEPMAVFYPMPRTFPVWQVAAAAALLAGVSALAVLQRRRRPYLSVGWLLYAGMLVPVIGLVQVGSQSIADRYTYLPSIGLFVVIAWGASEALSGSRSGRRLLAVGAVAALAACAAASRAHLPVWKNSETLWSHALDVTTGNFTAHQGLASALARRGDLDRAEEHLEAALRIRPGYAEARANLGALMLRRGRTGEALEHLREAVRLEPSLAEARANLAAVHLSRGETAEAVRLLQETLARWPDLAEARVNLALALDRMGRRDEAIAHLREALRLRPDLAAARSALDTMLRRERSEAGRGEPQPGNSPGEP